MKTIPIPNNKKTVVLGDIDIFFKDKVGTLLTNKIAITTVRKGVIFFISNPKFKSVSSYMSGIKINKPPAGDGIPSKKLYFHVSDVEMRGSTIKIQDVKI